MYQVATSCMFLNWFSHSSIQNILGTTYYITVEMNIDNIDQPQISMHFLSFKVA